MNINLYPSLSNTFNPILKHFGPFSRSLKTINLVKFYDKLIYILGNIINTQLFLPKKPLSLSKKVRPLKGLKSKGCKYCRFLNAINKRYKAINITDLDFKHFRSSHFEAKNSEE